MNETSLGSRLFLGYTSDGDRVYVYVNVGRGEGGQTVEHAPIGAYDTLSIMGEVYSGAAGFQDSQCIRGGQCLSDAAAVLACGGRLARNATEADVRLILDAWERWHLNGMRGACAHMQPVGESVTERLHDTPPCPLSGYRYGEAWLVAPLPGDLIDRLTEACRRLSR